MNNFLVRTPMFPLESLMEFYNSRNPETFIFTFFIENGVFRESIYIYSKVLHRQALKHSNQENKDLLGKRKNKVAESLIKYFLRMCYRATPFGLAAGVSIAKFGTQNLKNKNINYERRHVRIDSGVLFNILEEINSFKVIRDNVRFYRNNTLYIKNGYYRYIERRMKEASFEFNLERVEKTDFLEEILELSKAGVKCIDIINLLKEDEDITKDDVNDFIENLIDSQLILSELQYNVLDMDFEKTLNQQLKNIITFNNLSDPKLTCILLRLDEVCCLLKNLKTQVLGSEIALKIIEEIDSLLSPYNRTEKSALQIDLISEVTEALSHNVKEEIKNKISFFEKINIHHNSENHDIENFKKSYINQYGNKTTQLLEVLDPDLGIGYPVKLSINNFSSFLDRMNIKIKGTLKRDLTPWDDFLLEKYEQALIENKKKIQINDEDLFFSNVSGKEEINDVVLFTGQILKNEEDDYFKYFCTSLKVGAAHSIAGRFAYGHKKIEKFCKSIGEKEKERLSSHQVFSELLHLSQPRLGNVTLRPNCYDYYIPIIDASNKDVEHCILLNDLYIAIDDSNNIILYSKKLNKQVLPRLGCAQNTELLTSPIYKFLGAISDDYYISTWSWSFLSNRSYLPRVESGKFILCKEKWLLNYKTIFNSNRKDIEVLNEYIINKKINRYVTMSLGGDNLLPLDLQHNQCMRILLKELKTKHKVILEEDLYANTIDTIFLNKNKNTTNEVCIPITPKKNIKTQKHSINLEKINSRINLANTLSEIKSFPFDKVLYVKIYPKPGISVDNIFIDKFLLLFNNLKKDKSFDNLFFIRYIDPTYHFRVRFFANKSKFYKIIEDLNSVFSYEIKSFLIDKIQIDTYEREIERYGGGLGLEISEKIFYFDSVCVLQVLSWVKRKTMHDNLWLISIVGVDCLFNDFSIELENRLITLTELRNYYFTLISNSKEVNKNISNFYNEKRNIIEKNMNSAYFENDYFTFFKERSVKNQILIHELIKNEVEVDVKSYIHMFLNRLFESNQNLQETLVYDILIRYYNSLKFKK